MKQSTISKRNRKQTNSKQANQHKLRVIENAKRILNNITICNIFVPNDKENGWGNSAVFEKNHMIKVSPALAWNLDNIRVKWEVTCGVFCRSQNGEHYAEYYTIEADRECLSIDVADQAQKICFWLFENAIKMEKLCPFWLAIPKSIENHDVDLTLAIKTAHRHQVFNRIGTNFEHNCNIPFKDYHSGNWFNIPFNWNKFREADVDLNEALSIKLNYKETKDGTIVST